MSYLDDLLFGLRTIEDEGVVLPTRTKLNFLGTGVTAADNAVTGAIDVTIPGVAGSAGGWTDAGTVVRLTTSTDTVVIGASSTLLGEIVRVDLSGIGTGLNIGQAWSNVTAATSGVPQQYSPSIILYGTTWDGAASQSTGWALQSRGTVASPPVNYLQFIVNGTFGNVDAVQLYYNASADQGIAWGQDRQVTFKQYTRTGVNPANNMLFLGQAPTDGNGGGFLFTAQAGVGTNRNGGGFLFNAGARTGTGVEGNFRVQIASQASLMVAGLGAAAGSLYVGTETTLGEPAGAIVAITNGSAAFSGLDSWAHAAGDLALLNLGKTRGTRASPTTVVSGDYIGAVASYGHDGTSMVSGASILFKVEATVSTGVVPTSLLFAAGSSGNGVIRGAFSGVTGGLYVGDTVTLSEDAGSIVSVATTSGTRGFSAYQHSSDTNFAELNLFKSRGTRSSPSAVSFGSVDSIGRIRFVGYAGATGGYVSRAYISCYVDGTVVDGATPTLPMAIQIGNTAAAGNSVARIDIASSGGQTHDTDANAADFWKIGGVGLLELKEVATGRRVASLCRNGTLTTTEMPTNTGDRVGYLANAGTNPSANPVSGIIFYGDTGAGKARGTGGTVTTWAPS